MDIMKCMVTIIKQYTTITTQLGDEKGTELCFSTSTLTITAKLCTMLQF